MNGFMKIDMHVHTKHSDGISKVKDLIRFARKKEIGFAITDHNEISGVIEAFKIKKNSDTIIPGIEVHTKEGPHFLVYFDNLHKLKNFYEKYVLPNKKNDPFSRTNLPIKKLAKISEKIKGIVCCAHPEGILWANLPRVCRTKKINENILGKFHAGEILNGQHSKKMNRKALLFAEKNNLATIGGSDAHSLMEFGRVITIAEAKNIGEFLKAIKNRQTIVIGRESPRRRKAPGYINIIKKHYLGVKPVAAIIKSEEFRAKMKTNIKENRLALKIRKIRKWNGKWKRQ
jgi:predicted metal-dependent phosphoesterase TrpH